MIHPHERSFSIENIDKNYGSSHSASSSEEKHRKTWQHTKWTQRESKTKIKGESMLPKSREEIDT